MPQTKPPGLDPDELRTVTLTNTDIGNLMAALDGMVRGQGLQAAETALALAGKLTGAQPVAEGQ